MCFPHAGGSASHYFALSSLLTPRVEVLAMQYPGRQDRRTERYINNIPQLADGAVAALRPWIARPYAFFGHSLGAVLAFEVARRLAAAGQPGPVRLFASGRRGPATVRDERVHLRDDAGVIAELRALSGTDQRLLQDEELLAMILPITRNDYRAIETYTYTPGPPLSCPITVLVGTEDPKTTIEEASTWGEHSAAGSDVRVFPGGHFFLDEHRAAVAREISTALAGVASLHGGTA